MSVSAQVKQEVIASAGGYSLNGNLSISWTLGETIIPTFQNGNLILTHGFQQQLIITSVEENLEELVKVTVYPNPASDNINISFGEPLDGEVRVFLINSQGKLVKTDVIGETIIEKQMNLQDFPSGVYYLKLTKGKLSNVYKVVKL
jgi:hypothetical protein